MSNTFLICCLLKKSKECELTIFLKLLRVLKINNTKQKRDLNIKFDNSKLTADLVGKQSAVQGHPGLKKTLGYPILI